MLQSIEIRISPKKFFMSPNLHITGFHSVKKQVEFMLISQVEFYKSIQGDPLHYILNENNLAYQLAQRLEDYLYTSAN